MSKELWTAVDQYIGQTLVRTDAALDAALAASKAAKLPNINVAPNQGKLLQLLAKMIRARNILEIGTLGGYSTLWLARGLEPGGKLLTLEYEPRHAEVARSNIARAGLAETVQIRVGPAINALPQIEREKLGPFDLVFIDADKSSTPDYFQWALKLTHPGSVIIVDNVIRDGAIIQSDSTDTGVIGIRKFNEMVSRESRVSATAIQTVGSKGYDGLAILLVVE